jgi:methylmalonyl-CoA mutase cobalamin-binding domain/chain
METPLKPQGSEPRSRLPADAELALPSLRQRTRRFFEQEGRRPRALVGALQRPEGAYPAEQLGALLAEAGFDVDLPPMPMPPDHLAAMALDNDVHAVVILTVRSADESLLRELIRALSSGGAEDIVLAIDHPAVCDRLRRHGSHPLVCLPDGGMLSVARLLDALERQR